MFEVAELGRTLSKDEFKELEPEMREGLLDAQFRMRESDFSIVIVVGGVEGAGKGDLVNRLIEWTDARRIHTHALGAPTTEELERPEYYRYWMRLPADGKIGIFLGSWYTKPIVDHALDETTGAEFEQRLRKIEEFERMIVSSGNVLLKFWLHISKDHQRERFEALESDPMTSFRVTRRDWDFHERFETFERVSARAIRETDTGVAPWTLIEAQDARYRDMTVAAHIREAIEQRLDLPPLPDPGPPEELVPEEPNIISVMDLSETIGRKAYKQRLEFLQNKLGMLARKLPEHGCSMVLVFEGSDAAGKGGSIRRVVSALDARQYRVIPIAAPTDEERAHPYLWRFWRQLPRRGRITIYDRSWYGRVLVERVEGFARPEEWKRAFGEINQFEEQLAEADVIVLKFWLQISDDEQLARFRAREETGYKRHKITDEDWRNREKAGAYQAAASEMIERTSTDMAPWTLVPAESKPVARLKVLETIVARLEERFGPLELPDVPRKKKRKKKK
jgi:polyphosphate:AMP phosphotransferase